MICRRLPWIATLLGAFLAMPAPLALAQETMSVQVNWRSDYSSARQEAKEKGLPLVIDFGTKYCTYCVKLDQTTFRDPRVIGVMNERFIPLKIDADIDVQLASQLRISSFPTVVLAGPEGNILSTMVGYKDAGDFHENLQRALSKVSSPDWMQRDLDMATNWMRTGDYARAINSLRTILEDGKSRPIQASAEKLMRDLEQIAEDRLAKARDLQDKGQSPAALAALTETMRAFPGLPAAKEASALVTQLAQTPELRQQQRLKRARELLVQAKEFYKNREFICCHDRCEWLVASYGDLPEGQEAALMVSEMNNNPEWLQGAADSLSERLGTIWLALADAHLKRGQTQLAEAHLQRVLQAFPGSRQAEAAQFRLWQVQGAPPARRPDISAGSK